MYIHAVQAHALSIFQAAECFRVLSESDAIWKQAGPSPVRTYHWTPSRAVCRRWELYFAVRHFLQIQRGELVQWEIADVGLEVVVDVPPVGLMGGGADLDFGVVLKKLFGNDRTPQPKAGLNYMASISLFRLMIGNYTCGSGSWEHPPALYNSVQTTGRSPAE